MRPTMKMDADQSTQGTTARRQRVLVVEDEPMVAEVVERYLRRDGYDVSVIHDGERALAQFERVAADFVDLDIMLPGLDGFEVCCLLRGTGDTPAIMLTARSQEHDKLLDLSFGAY